MLKKKIPALAQKLKTDNLYIPSAKAVEWKLADKEV